jgi:hypothetical protein
VVVAVVEVVAESCAARRKMQNIYSYRVDISLEEASLRRNFICQ